jgi:hypothetical protein
MIPSTTGTAVERPFAKNGTPGAPSYLDNNRSKKSSFLQSDPEFKRQDFQIYISNLSQRAGVPTDQIRNIILKELVDNALDEMDRVGQPGQVTITQDGEHTYTVTDQGRGFPDTPDELAKRFSLDKGMVSSKQWRKPTRGCVGNGLRVIVGAVVSGGGRIIVKTRDRHYTLLPRLDGTTAIENIEIIDWPVGSSVTVQIDPKYPRSAGAMQWAQTAIKLAQSSGPPFGRQPSPWWFDTEHLALNMLSAIGPTYTLAQFVSQLDRCSSRKIGRLVTDMFGKGCLCRDLSLDQASKLLKLLRDNVPTQILPKQLGPMGREAWKSDGYACEEGYLLTASEPRARIPFLVESWARTCAPRTNTPDDLPYPVEITDITINRSPAIATYNCQRSGRARDVWVNIGGGGWISVPQGAFKLFFNITSPYIPILSDNKTPSLSSFATFIRTAIETAIKRAARNNPPVLVSRVEDSKEEEEEPEKKPPRIPQRSSILKAIPAAVDHCRNNENGIPFFEFNVRDLYYAVRNLVLALGVKEPAYGYFSSILTDFENEFGEIDKLNRDARGVFIEPHGGRLISMGTKTVDAYTRPPWKYSNLLFIEKEKYVSLLEQVRFQDRWDCFVMTSKGYSTRAARDLIDKISEKDEPTNFFCVHDADASGPLIYEKLVEATKSRGARKVEVIDLGFFPWTCMEKDLPKEPVEKKDKRRAVAKYVKKRDEDNNASGNPNHEPNWEKWLQSYRYELNILTPQEFLTWLTDQFTEHGASKVIPTEDVVLKELTDDIEILLDSDAQDEVEEERQEELDDLEEQLKALKNEIKEEAISRADERLKEIKMPTGLEAIEKLKEWLQKQSHSHWRIAIPNMAYDFIHEGG